MGPLMVVGVVPCSHRNVGTANARPLAADRLPCGGDRPRQRLARHQRRHPGRHQDALEPRRTLLGPVRLSRPRAVRLRKPRPGDRASAALPATTVLALLSLPFLAQVDRLGRARVRRARPGRSPRSTSRRRISTSPSARCWSPDCCCRWRLDEVRRPVGATGRRRRSTRLPTPTRWPRAAPRRRPGHRARRCDARVRRHVPRSARAFWSRMTPTGAGARRPGAGGQSDASDGRGSGRARSSSASLRPPSYTARSSSATDSRGDSSPAARIRSRTSTRFVSWPLAARRPLDS